MVVVQIPHLLGRHLNPCVANWYRAPDNANHYVI
jgi:hypothetical protein